MTKYIVRRIGDRFHPLKVWENGCYEVIRHPEHGGPLNYAHSSSAYRYIRKRREQED